MTITQHGQTRTVVISDAELQSLFDSSLEELRSDTMALMLRLHNHRDDLGPRVNERLAEQVELMRGSLDQLRCDFGSCMAIGLFERAGEFYCAEHAQLWAECDHCHEDTLIAELCSVGSSDALLCPGCLPDGVDIWEDKRT